MKLRKNGHPVLSKDALWVATGQHQHFSENLMWLVQRSLDTLLGNQEKLQVEDGESLPKHMDELRRIRWREEAIREKDEDEEIKALSPEYYEIRCLVDTLMKWAIAEGESADACRSIAQGIQRGRPKAASTYTGNSLVELLKSSPRRKIPQKAGRKRAVDIPDETLLAALKANEGQGHSERDVLRMIAAKVLQANGMHSVGDRVTRMAANLQKRVSGARARVRKSNP